MVLSEEAATAYPARGTWVSPSVETDRPFTEWLPSWNVDTPDATGLRMDVRVRDAESGAWSPWLKIATWGELAAAALEVPKHFDGGRVEVDILKLNRPADAYEIRVSLFNHAADPSATPTVRRVVAVASGVSDAIDRLPQTMPHTMASTSQSASQAWLRDLDVPFRTQQSNPEAMRPRTCSPTSVAMVMAYRGVDLPTVEHAVGIYDAEHGIFGNWGRAVAWASQHGLAAELVRLRDWSHVESHIAAGQPLIASIAFDEGAFPSNLMKQTDGHLIVIRGLTADGHAIVNDPASADRGHGVIYKKDELAAAWFGRGGVTYVIGEPIMDRTAPTAAASTTPRGTN